MARIWRKWHIQPHRIETFKFSTDPELEAKIRDVVGLYLAPPDNAVVVCVDEKSQIQALDRTAPPLPLRPGLAARRTHDYTRHGTTTLFAALETATGKITADACYPRHRHQEFLRFLKKVAAAHPGHGPARGAGQLRHAQAPRDPPVAGQAGEPADHPALHPDQLLLAEHGRDLLRHHHPPGQRMGAGRRSLAAGSDSVLTLGVWHRHGGPDRNHRTAGARARASKTHAGGSWLIRPLLRGRGALAA